jgi:hypothetical protein
MAHNPINHPARPVWRAISGLIGLYFLVFGLLGFFMDGKVFGQGTNATNSVLSVIIGLVVLGATVVGRNIDTAVFKPLGYLLMALGLLTLAVSRTEANILDHTVSTCVVWMVLGLTLLVSGMYIKVGTGEDRRAFEHARLTG